MLAPVVAHFSFARTLTHTQIFETIVEASKQIQNGKSAYERTYEIQMALMGITVAHELCHFFIGFLVGYRRPQTPPDIIYLPKDHKTIEGDPTGESSRWREAEVFGGEARPFTEPLADLNAPNKHHSATDKREIFGS